MIQLVALGICCAEADHDVREVGGNNRGPRVREYLAAVGFGEGAAWCGGLIFYGWRFAARDVLGVPNPLDIVPEKALVQSYYETFQGRVVDPYDAPAGSLVLMKFGANPRDYDHIGMLRRPIPRGEFAAMTIEGNTGPGLGSTDMEREREGDGVYLRTRGLDEGKRPLLFIDVTGGDRE